MIPYMVETINGRAVRTPWPMSKVKAKMKEMRTELHGMFRKRDVAEARRLGKGDCVVTLDDETECLQPLRVTQDSSGAETMRVDPIAAEIKHSGAEFVDAFRDRWAILCSSPQDPEQVEAIPPYAKKAGVTRLAMSPITQVPETPKKRGPGRPRKSEQL